MSHVSIARGWSGDLYIDWPSGLLEATGFIHADIVTSLVYAYRSCSLGICCLARHLASRQATPGNGLIELFAESVQTGQQKSKSRSMRNLTSYQNHTSTSSIHRYRSLFLSSIIRISLS
jgi:hypothetical protein